MIAAFMIIIVSRVAAKKAIVKITTAKTIHSTTTSQMEAKKLNATTKRFFNHRTWLGICP